jgi:hypothetical protein
MKQKMIQAGWLGITVIGTVIMDSCTNGYSSNKKYETYDTAVVRKTVGGNVYIDTGGKKSPDLYIYDKKSSNPPVIAKKGDTIVYNYDIASNKVNIDTLLPKNKKK